MEIYFTKSAQENANDYFNRAKKLVIKKEGAQKAIKELEKRLEKEQEKPSEEKKTRILKVQKKEWYEKFHWFFTSNGLLAIGGRDAQQNEQLNSKHFTENDLFFHAEIFGASVVILKEGLKASKEIREEVAQFAASYSSAWKDMLKSIDVYAMKREQVSKSTSKGSLGTGSFLLSGERDWYRNTQLSLVMFVKDNKLNTVPHVTFEKLKSEHIKHVKIIQGNQEKSEAAKRIANSLDFDDLDSIIRELPAGTFGIKIHNQE